MAVKHVRLGLSYLLAAVSILAFQNCADQTFSSITVTDDNNTFITNTGGPNCRQILESITTPVKMIFVVDVSGSNKDTDPDKSLRGGAISRFFNTYKAKTNFDWTMTSFSNDKAVTHVSSGNTAQMNDAIAWFWAHEDKGETPYAVALDNVYDFINGDSSRLPDTKYLIVFLSDGRPNPDIENSDLRDRVEKITGLVTNSISLNTVYYGPYDKDAHDRLKNMATWGGGNFLDVNNNPTGGNFNISDLVIVPPVDQCD